MLGKNSHTNISKYYLAIRVKNVSELVGGWCANGKETSELAEEGPHSRMRSEGLPWDSSPGA